MDEDAPRKRFSATFPVEALKVTSKRELGVVYFPTAFNGSLPRGLIPPPGAEKARKRDRWERRCDTLRSAISQADEAIGGMESRARQSTLDAQSRATKRTFASSMRLAAKADARHRAPDKGMDIRAYSSADRDVWHHDDLRTWYNR